MTRAGGRLENWGFGVSCIPKLGEGGPERRPPLHKLGGYGGKRPNQSLEMHPKAGEGWPSQSLGFLRLYVGGFGRPRIRAHAFCAGVFSKKQFR